MSRRSRSHKERPGPAGFLVIDKPVGWTSHDVVGQVRRWLGTRRVGHLGTLDPLATGVLPLAVREATKLIPYLEKARKCYLATFELGVETDSYDADGEVLRRFEGPLPERETLAAAMRAFEGDIEQIPPMFSAVKMDGVPLYKLARKGEEVERPPRPVHIDSFILKGMELPRIKIEVTCSTGTYVRTLAHDLGQGLGCGAHVAQMQRTESSPFVIEDAVTLEQLEKALAEGKGDALFVPPERALGLPLVHLALADFSRILHGGEISARDPRVAPGTRFAAIAPDGGLCAVLEARGNRRLAPLRVLRQLAS